MAVDFLKSYPNECRSVNQVIKYSSVKYETTKLQKIYLVCAAKILQSLVLSNMTFHRIEREREREREREFPETRIDDKLFWFLEGCKILCTSLESREFKYHAIFVSGNLP